MGIATTERLEAIVGHPLPRFRAISLTQTKDLVEGGESNLYDTFFASLEEDYRQACSCATRGNRYEVAPRPRGTQRFVIWPSVVRDHHVSALRYQLQAGDLALDIFFQVMRRILAPSGAIFTMEFDKVRVSAYTIDFG